MQVQCLLLLLSRNQSFEYVKPVIHLMSTMFLYIQARLQWMCCHTQLHTILLWWPTKYMCNSVFEKHHRRWILYIWSKQCVKYEFADFPQRSLESKATFSGILMVSIRSWFLVEDYVVCGALCWTFVSYWVIICTWTFEAMSLNLSGSYWP